MTSHLDAHETAVPMMDRPTGPLVGLRIIDVTHALAGPFAGLFLADLGAEIDRADNEGRTPLSIADGLYVAGTFVIQESTAALPRQPGAEQPSH